MDLTAFSEQNFFIFILPGFITVWSFRYFTDSKKKGDFEFLALAFIWGMLNLALFGLMVQWGVVKKFPSDIPVYGQAFILSFFGFMFGLLGAQISKWGWVRDFLQFLKSNFLGELWYIIRGKKK